MLFSKVEIERWDVSSEIQQAAGLSNSDDDCFFGSINPKSSTCFPRSHAESDDAVKFSDLQGSCHGTDYIFSSYHYYNFTVYYCKKQVAMVIFLRFCNILNLYFSNPRYESEFIFVTQ